MQNKNYLKWRLAPKNDHNLVRKDRKSTKPCTIESERCVLDTVTDKNGHTILKTSLVSLENMGPDSLLH